MTPAPRILVVDNDASMRQLLELAFRQEGHEVFATGCPEKARLALAEGGVAAMLLDYHLGAGVSGTILLERWRQERELPPFWLVTGMPDDPEVLAAKELEGCQGVVGKPFPVLQLVADVGELLGAPGEGA